jgi:hypothetical protein
MVEVALLALIGALACRVRTGVRSRRSKTLDYSPRRGGAAMKILENP